MASMHKGRETFGERNLAAAVVRQAIHDLRPSPDVSEFCSTQAARFLMESVWKSGCWCTAATRLFSTEQIDRLVATRLPATAQRRLSDRLQARLADIRQ
jgi:hypothetical protein